MPPRLVSLVSCLLLVVTAGMASAMGFSCGTSPSFHQEAANCDFVVIGSIQRTRGGGDKDATELVVAEVLKAAPLGFAKGMILKLPAKASEVDPKCARQCVVFGDLEDGAFHVFRGNEVNAAQFAYLRGLLRIETSDRAGVLRYCFDHLADADREIARDAYREFASWRDDAVMRATARQFRPDQLRRWIQDDKLETYQLSLFAYLLGHCGDSTDVPALRKRLDGMTKTDSVTDFDAFLIGYTLLAPKDGWAYTRDVVANPKLSFVHRYGGLLTARHFYSARPDLVPRRDVLGVVSLLIHQGDIADLAINQLCAWRCWRYTDRILPRFQEKGVERIVRRSVLRYALQCPMADAVHFAADRRLAAPAEVADAEELLRLSARP